MSSSFADLGVSPEIVGRLARQGITAPFPIQAATIADALAGRDVCGRAPTGSGKTLAFGIPLMSRLDRARARRPRGLVLVPTRELAAQVRTELLALAGPKGRSVVAIYGGVGFGPQVDALRRGTDIVVACPGRLADLVARGNVILDEVAMVVIDEADRMADMGFLPEVRRLLDQVRPDRQTLLFSATLDGDVDVLITHYQRTPVRHELAEADDEPSSRHVFWRAERPQRVALTAGVVNAEWPAIVFCRTKHGADRLTRQLTTAGISAAAIHGGRSQNQRERTLAAFGAGKVQALVATDVAARGIHVDGIACVVHFDPPGDGKDYVHRSGRTGRAGTTGVVVTMVGTDQEVEIRQMQRRLGLPVGLHAAELSSLQDERHAARPTTSSTASSPSTGGSSPAPPRSSTPKRRRRFAPPPGGSGQRSPRGARPSRPGGNRPRPAASRGR
ncbi:MAG: DEAD/DEAH box helicase [Actinobacteria bacterium]|nr:DEAD/DEAH box helicase [Actinomycetota bacterium]